MEQVGAVFPEFPEKTGRPIPPRTDLEFCYAVLAEELDCQTWRLPVPHSVNCRIAEQEGESVKAKNNDT